VAVIPGKQGGGVGTVHGAAGKPEARPLSSEAPRRFTPTALGALVPRLARPAFRRLPPAAAQLLTEWEALAGPAAARLGTPIGFSRGTLTIAAAGPAAMELGMLAPVLIERINGALGRRAVERFRFVQTRLPAVPAAPVARPAAPPPARLGEAIGRVESPELREALARLAAGLYRDERSR
jgi:hypothetical protein